ncbi:MAG TPA: hypothetical protein VGQ90_00250 [Stellaceae bacterium]|nr:hypothetical protein [Stellaceae bacterium]
MRAAALALFSALGLAASVTAAGAAPAAPPPVPSQDTDIVQVSGGCGWGFHRHHGYCVRNRHHRPYAYRPYYPHYGYYRPHRHYGYYGGGYGSENLNRPSPSDHIANQLNAQQLNRGYYWGY